MRPFSQRDGTVEPIAVGETTRLDQSMKDENHTAPNVDNDISSVVQTGS